jgi:YidC/Oxa1 family membrane protein insertase
VIAFAPWQTLLNGLGWVIAQIYELIPNYGVSIILLTVLIRVVLLPLGIKQVRSMQHMQIVQPKVKQIQQKFKGNKQRQQEEIMKVYREYGVNPFSGCWPVLLQFPILIAMYSVVRFPQHPIHIPEGTELYAAVTAQIPQTIDGEPVTSQDQIDGADLPGPADGTTFLGMNLLCSATHAGREDATLGDRVKVPVEGGESETVQLAYPVDCGGNLNRIPYYVFAVLMFGTTFYQQRQMQKASPPGAASQQQQALLKLMPIMFGVFGIFFPAGLVVYWTTSNGWQIVQQYYMLRTRPTAETLAAAADGRRDRSSSKKGFFASIAERAAEERKRRGGSSGQAGASGGKSRDAEARDAEARDAALEPAEEARLRRHWWRRSEEAPQALRKRSRPPSRSWASVSRRSTSTSCRSRVRACSGSELSRRRCSSGFADR